MNKMIINPKKREIHGIPFGSSMETVRKTFGELKESGIYESLKEKIYIDRFNSGVTAYYNENESLISVDIPNQIAVYNGKKKIFPTSMTESSKNLESEFKQKGGNYFAESSLTSIQMSGSKMNTITFYENLSTLKTFPEKKKRIEKEKIRSLTESTGDVINPVELEKPKSMHPPASLMDLYDNLSSNMRTDSSMNSEPVRVSGPDATSNASTWMKKANIEADRLRNQCHKRILLDIYCNILPLDDDYKNGNQGELQNDIDAMLTNKNQTATQYLQSCSDTTKAPLVEFVLRAGDIIANQFLEDAKETLKDAKEQDIAIPEPEADVDNPEVEEQLVDVTQDGEYENFIDQLKKKTINKIVDDVSKIISDKKEEQNMTFDPKPVSDEIMAAESTISVALNYLNHQLLLEHIEIDDALEEQMIGMAIRESTLNVIDLVFKQPESDFKSYFNRIRYGKGVLINESARTFFVENGEQPGKRYEPLYKELDGNKYDISNYEKVDKDGKKTPMSDQDAKKVLDPEGYKNYQNRNHK